MKSSIIILLLSLFIVKDSLAKDFLAFKPNDCKYETKNGLLDGKFSQNYSNGELMVEGKFINNQRVGTWNFYSVTSKLVEKRIYFNNYEYAVMNNDKKTWKQFDTNGKWSPIKEENVKLKSRVYKFVKKENSGFLDMDKLTKVVNTNTDLDFYSDERFAKQADKKQLKDIKSLKIIEDYIYDNEHETMFTRTVGLGFVNSKNETVAWIYFPELIEDLRNVKSNWKNDHTAMRTMYDVFVQRAYFSTPYNNSTKEVISDKTMVELDLEFIHFENLFIIAKA